MSEPPVRGAAAHPRDAGMMGHWGATAVRTQWGEGGGSGERPIGAARAYTGIGIGIGRFAGSVWFRGRVAPTEGHRHKHETSGLLSLGKDGDSCQSMAIPHNTENRK